MITADSSTNAMDLDPLMSPVEQLSTRDQVELLKTQANAEFKAGNYLRASEMYGQALEISDDVDLKATLLSNRAAAYLMLNKYKKALEDCKISLQLDGDSAKTGLRLAKCYLGLGRPSDAMRSLEQYYPDNKDMISRVSLCQKFIDTARQDIDKCQFGRAKVSIQQALSIVSLQSVPTSWNLMKCECLIGEGDLNEASLMVNDVLRSESGNAEGWFLRARISYANGDLTKCVTFCSEALRADPDSSKARLLFKRAKSLESAKEQGNAAFKSGKNEEALDFYTRALEIDPDCKEVNCKLFSNRSMVYSRLGQYDKSNQDCDRALDIDPQFLKVLLRRADNNMKLENYEKAVQDYEKAQSLDSSNRDIRTALRDAKLQLKKSKRKDYYKLLGVSKSASDSEIKKAYRKLALQYHPDKVSEEERETSEAKFKDISEAYTVLSDPQKKARFDSGADLDGGMSDMGGGMNGMNQEDILNMFFAGQAGGMGGGFPGGGGFHFGHGGGGYEGFGF